MVPPCAADQDSDLSAPFRDHAHETSSSRAREHQIRLHAVPAGELPAVGDAVDHVGSDVPVRGHEFGIDFAGGTQVDIRAKSGEAHIADIRSKAEGLGLGPVEVQQIGSDADVLLRLNVQPGGEQGQQTAIAKLHDAFSNDYEFRAVNSVGPSVSAELVQSGTLGVVVAILAVLTYLWFRFEWQFAVGAIIGTMHDLLLTVGFFCVTQIEFNQTSIAAILTIVGYSLNETVVVLDRIREVMRKYKRLSTAEIIDMSINAVLPRTIMTATTVFLALLALVLLRRPRHPLVLGGDDLGHFRRHLLVDLHLLADADLHGRPRRRVRQEGQGGRGGAADARRRCDRPCCALRREATASRVWRRRVRFRRHGAYRARSSRRRRACVRSPRRQSMTSTRAPAPLFAELAERPGSIEFLVIGSGAQLALAPKSLRAVLREAGLRFEAMATGPALRVYNVMQSEDRRVAAVLIAAP